MKKLTSVLLSVAMLLTMAVMFSGCGGPSEKAIYPKSIKVEGTNGHGVIDERLSTDLVSEKRRMAEKAANRDLYDHYKSLKKVYNDCVVTVVDGENKNLSNGDTVTIKITSDRGYDKDMLEQLGISEDELSFEEFKYEVQGLNEPQEVEAKKDDIDIEFNGYSGEGRASVKYNNSDNAINYELSSEDNLSNGDKVTVTPSISETNDTYVLKNPKEKFDFTVSGLPEFPDSLDGIDTSEVDDFINKYVSDGFCKHYQIGDEIDYDQLKLKQTDKFSFYYDEVTKINIGKPQENTTKYYKYKNQNRALYSKKLKIDYDVKYGRRNKNDEKSMKYSEESIIYANVVVVDGKLHLANSNYDNDSGDISEEGSEPKYLSDYRNNDGPISYGKSYEDTSTVIGSIFRDTNTSADDNYTYFIDETDVKSSDYSY